MQRTKSQALFERAKKVIPGGVNSPVRAFKAVGGDPPFMARGKGARVWDADGNEYVDWCGSWGPLILGHAHPAVLEAIAAAAKDGTSFGAPTEREVVFAERIAKAIPSVERVRLTSSGTEATMSAIRVARAFTGRHTILKFEGCFHGHHDGVLVKAGSGVATLGLPDSPGVPEAIAGLTATARFNDLADAERAFAEAEKAGKPIGAIILEPVVGNMGVVAPKPGFLTGLRSLCDRKGALLIFDEVITGFRLRFGGYQQTAGVKPDLTCLGKILGGGLPVGAYGGRAEIMDLIAPAGSVYQSGTLSGNPLAVAAGLAMLDEVSRPGFYEKLDAAGARVAKGLAEAAAVAKATVRIQREGSMLTVFFTGSEVTDWPSAARCDKAAFGRWHRGLLENGVYWPPAQFEAAFVSAAHADADLDRTVEAARKAFAAPGARA
jgi:glutamate-1-semialdehyde 2,1-aminomutase